LLLTGGNDIYPAWYGKEADTARCGVFNRKRDTLEMKALELAIEKEMPVMGICRGMQLVNVHLGGTLYVDLPQDIGSETLHRGEGDGWKQHLVYSDREFFPLEDFSAQPQLVATNHHQGIDRLAEGLRIITRSSDSLPEALQWEDTTKSLLFAVQWHPEWKPLAGEMALPLAEYFLEAATAYRSKR
jgi:putative glutamine amidotransferase